ncbi:mushroom body large-type Kenyon cell-specific protein 1 [Drosophila elegans]|uniref:mushroom body large-type Kenyon cell-specific protein 1 n=1 Tax=Drosophila elegans TaxID=30023 RepID=UPI0007E830A7|nr:mushroom body large-type Kenyon cell-specific protein 1 [Drosophila elegans]
MAYSRSSKGCNWPGILDSSHALRKYFPSQATSSQNHDRLPTFDPPNFVGAEPKPQPRVNAAWQLASDPSDFASIRGPKRPKGLRDRERKRVERKIWARPAKIDVAKRAARSPDKPERLEKAEVATKPPIRPGIQRKKVRASSPTDQKRPSLSFRSPRRRKILVVDAKRTPRVSHQAQLAGGAEGQPPTSSASGRKWEGQHPKLRMRGRSKKTYGVPLCSRPTEIMAMAMGRGSGVPYSRQMQMRQEQLYQQPEYQDQYMRMLHEQQRQQQEQQQKDCALMAQHPYSILPGVLSEEEQIQSQHQPHVYSVPSKSPLKRLRNGKRMCGNFYYD